jgi:anti-anti-sigma factor
MELTTTIETTPVQVTVIHVNGILNIETAREFEKYVKEAIGGGARYILLDMQQVSFMSSEGIRALNSIFRALDASSGINNAMAKDLLDGTYRSPHLKLVNLRPNVAEVLNLVGMTTFLEIHQNMAEALASFQSRA